MPGPLIWSAMAMARNCPLVAAMLTLVANSRGTELERREVGAARLGKRRSVCPGCDSQEVDCNRRDDMLQAGFDKTPIACAAHPTAADRLGVGAFDAGPR